MRHLAFFVQLVSTYVRLALASTALFGLFVNVETGVNVMIAIFGDFSPTIGEKWRFSRKPRFVFFFLPK
jgi:hypothetical protein